jgi:hypothetical protein
VTASALPPPQDLAAATVQGWGRVTSAWLEAAEHWWLTILEWAFDECAYTGPNQTCAYAIVDEETPLRAEFYRTDGNGTALIPPTCVRIGRTTDEALAKMGAPPSASAAPAGAVVLLVTLRPGPHVPPGGYRGRVLDDSTGAPVAENLFVYVATTS